ncbi:hypothetical protein MCC01971_22830 [Bifidobacteriaceae bacterium MCC01971]|nr:hypothetical protein MCC01971_22830 [Bifidobacteriaceae bacterium MCC01971]
MAHGETLRNLTNTRSNGREQQSGEQSKERKLSELAPPSDKEVQHGR